MADRLPSGGHQKFSKAQGSKAPQGGQPAPDPSATTQSGNSASDPTVDAKSGWQDSKIAVFRGEGVAVTFISGEWTVGFPGLPNVGPAGYPPNIDLTIFQPCKLLSSAPFGALLAKVGENGTPFLVGAHDALTAQDNGELFFRINDKDECLGDNAGSIDFELRIGANLHDVIVDNRELIKACADIAVPGLNVIDQLERVAPDNAALSFLNNIGRLQDVINCTALLVRIEPKGASPGPVSQAIGNMFDCLRKTNFNPTCVPPAANLPQQVEAGGQLIRNFFESFLENLNILRQTIESGGVPPTTPSPGGAQQGGGTQLPPQCIADPFACGGIIGGNPPR